MFIDVAVEVRISHMNSQVFRDTDGQWPKTNCESKPKCLFCWFFSKRMVKPILFVEPKFKTSGSHCLPRILYHILNTWFLFLIFYIWAPKIHVKDLYVLNTINYLIFSLICICWGWWVLLCFSVHCCGYFSASMSCRFSFISSSIINFFLVHSDGFYWPVLFHTSYWFPLTYFVDVLIWWRLKEQKLGKCPNSGAHWLKLCPLLFHLYQ